MEQTPEPVQQPVTSNVTKGITIALIIIFLSVLSYFIGATMQGWPQYLIYAVYVAGIMWSCVVYGKQLNGDVTFGNVFAHGFKVAAVVTVLMIGFTLALSAFSPEMKEKALETIRTEMAKNPKVTPDMVEKTEAIYTRWFTPILIGSALLGYLFLGLLGSLAGAAITKKNPPSYQG